MDDGKWTGYGRGERHLVAKACATFLELFHAMLHFTMLRRVSSRDLTDHVCYFTFHYLTLHKSYHIG